ncbi:MAG: DUF3297 family protein [Pseudomonadota bacterium]|nr:DUF3297 family protein [Pseudomonadota bacterium]
MADPKKPLPDRLSLNPRSPHFDEAVLSQGVGIRFNGVEKTNVVEYSVSEGWICVPAGRSLDRFGQPMQVKLKGVVEPYYEGDEVGVSETLPEASDEKGPGADAEA